MISLLQVAESIWSLTIILILTARSWVSYSEQGPQKRAISGHLVCKIITLDKLEFANYPELGGMFLNVGDW